MRSELNVSGLEPRGRAILVKPYEEKKPDSLIVMPDTVAQNNMMLENRAIVIECGPGAWPDEQPRAKPGEAVLIAKFAGFMAKGIDGELYRFVNDNDIFAALIEE